MSQSVEKDVLLIADVVAAHEFMSTSTSRNGINTHHAGCTCDSDLRFDWYLREAQHQAHVFAAVFAAGQASVLPPEPSRQYVEDSCRTCNGQHPLAGCADVGCNHNCEAEVRPISPGEHPGCHPVGLPADEHDAACPIPPATTPPHPREDQRRE